MITPSTQRHRCRGIVLAFVGILALTVSSCAERGNFGRPKETALSYLLAPDEGPTHSTFHFTDDERELRNRAWQFLMPARERSVFDRLLFDAARNGYWPTEYFPETLSWYYESLQGEKFRSPASRYAQLESDVFTDRKLLQTFSEFAAKVIHADALRARAIPRVQDISGEELRNANFRMQENIAVIGWVCYRASMRLQSFRYALEHAFVAMPQVESVRAERLLLGYEQDFEPLRSRGCISP
ncbi:MAG: hypothetical protein ACRCXM_03175, partial [Beijerinckiaceae bacterium]